MFKDILDISVWYPCRDLQTCRELTLLTAGSAVNSLLKYLEVLNKVSLS